ncbi:zinc finger protein 16-like [Thalassophryne amazonica]|uniref:zinc finger protein 16-like n=1 Tax=Thalassophryne amazonica TaxID=390379 RepID=UPI0014708930|nr:zinc finger protein 16-like [Thalassophryne amazonica]
MVVLPACTENEDGDADAEKVESSSIVCDICGKVMKCKSSLARHSFIHTGQKPYTCSLCDLRFNRRDNLQHHLNHLHPNGVLKVEKLRANEQSWLCAICGKTFNCRSRLKTHEVIHSGVKPHCCDLCPKAYMRVNDLEHHKKIVHADGAARPPRPCSLLCDLCGREFKSKSQLSVHYQTHTGERPHHCDTCGRKFARTYQLKRHKILIHSGSVEAEQSYLGNTSLTCTVCGKRLKSEAHLASHAHVHSGDKPYRCSFCLRGFHCRISLQQHHARMHQKLKVSEGPLLASGCKRSPSAPKLFPCLNCGKVFKFKSLLASHSVIHSDLRPHACEFCSRRFRRLSHLKRHREVVHDNGARLPQSFVCHICGKDKKCKSQLERHIIIHTGERPYGCDLCTARFNRHGNLKQHKKRMHGVVEPPSEEAPPMFSDEDGDLTYKQEETVIAVNDSEPQVREEVVS